MLKPGQPGTKKWVEKFGDKLYCVRYRYDEARKRKLITAEIIVEENRWQRKIEKLPQNKIVPVKVKWEESHIRKVIKSAGGRWNQKKKVWELPYRDVRNLGLTQRIVDDSPRDRGVTGRAGP